MAGAADPSASSPRSSEAKTSLLSGTSPMRGRRMSSKSGMSLKSLQEEGAK